MNDHIWKAPEAKKAVWIEENKRPCSITFICSECGEKCYFNHGAKSRSGKKFCGYKFCPNCGTEMLERILVQNEID